MKKGWAGFFFLALLPLAAQEPTAAKLKVLYNGLDPKSVAQHLAFYDLYSGSQEGQQALRDAYVLLSGGQRIAADITFLSPSLSAAMQAIVSLVNKPSSDNSIVLNEQELAVIDALAQRLTNRRLAGYQARNEAEVLALPPEQVDLARGVLLSQLGSSPESLRKVRSYEAAIDLMALQILARIHLNDPPQKKIRAINHFIFEELGFRFPPHSAYAKDIDLYTFLPSVLDSRRGVCLGVSILYICLAQRLDLNLEIVTPPGHIFVRCIHKGQEVNIETTARGINLPSEKYLGVDTRSLQQRNVKETIGMAHFNQASMYWENQQYDKALTSYARAKPYLAEDKLLVGLMAYAHLLQGNIEQALPLMQEVAGYTPEHAVSKDTIVEDYFSGAVDAEGIRAIFMGVDETRQSLLAKRDALQETLGKHPRFREGIFSLAGTWLQLHRTGEALETLKRYHEIDPENASVEYYLAELYAHRLDYNNAWKHLRIAEELTKRRNHSPKALKEFRQELIQQCPE